MIATSRGSFLCLAGPSLVQSGITFPTARFALVRFSTQAIVASPMPSTTVASSSGRTSLPMSAIPTRPSASEINEGTSILSVRVSAGTRKIVTRGRIIPTTAHVMNSATRSKFPPRRQDVMKLGVRGEHDHDRNADAGRGQASSPAGSSSNGPFVRVSPPGETSNGSSRSTCRTPGMNRSQPVRSGRTGI